ncbi:elongation of fatty acids protein 3-like protein [Nicotiana attenuata]|uniref:Elongation of fatty acids protein 3-like protein n=1 Tax=Nicotiana attenuata TaxID=49451 RepID=A0A314LFU9_NICAT|nr:elongation of fatty acids protein 3-like protein [Nicotiana attenuata]
MHSLRRKDVYLTGNFIYRLNPEKFTMEALYSSVHYWLVGHPTISKFEWKQGHTFGSSLLFLALSVSIYLSLTLLSLRFASHLPTLSATILHRITAVHSLILCLLSLIMVAGCSLSVLHQMPRHDWKWVFCFPTNHIHTRGPLFFWFQVCFLSKILEFIDTLLIIFSSSRSRRLSFLHVYHHAMVPVLGYLAIYTSQSMLHIVVITNASVHVLMYAYYFLCAIGKKPWWKRLVTNCQIVQFIFGFPCSAMMLYYHFTTKLGCSGFGPWCACIAFDVSLLALFLDFHSNNYGKNNRKGHDNKLEKQT